MQEASYKKYSEAAKRGIKGEAFFESLIVDHAIPHRIARQNDLGIDFLCEWIYGDRPTGLLFCAQVKTTTSETIACVSAGRSELNGLAEYRLTGAEKIDERTINYWKGLGLPAFLFYIVDCAPAGLNRLECYYKRYTPILDGRPCEADNAGCERFHKASDGSTFLAFADAKNEVGGFARDLIVDYARMCYSKGHLVELTPSKLGFWPFREKRGPDVRCFAEIVGWHRDKIEAICSWTTAILRGLQQKYDSSAIISRKNSCIRWAIR
jgi:hypothetical protein